MSRVRFGVSSPRFDSCWRFSGLICFIFRGWSGAIVVGECKWCLIKGLTGVVKCAW